MKKIKLILIFFASILTACLFAQNGDILFNTNCAACHSIGNGIVVGPDLKGVDEKHPESYLIQWIKSSQTVIKSGDTAAKAVYIRFNSMVMPDQPLSVPEIKSIIGYIKTESVNQIALADSLSGAIKPELAIGKNTLGTNSENTGTVMQLPNPDAFFNYLGIVLIAVFFLIILWVLTGAISDLSGALKEALKKNGPPAG